MSMTEKELRDITTALIEALKPEIQREVQRTLFAITNPGTIREQVRDVVMRTFNEEYDLRIGVTVQQKFKDSGL